MLNYITPEMIVNAAKLVQQGKVYALGEEIYNDVPRFINPTRFGPQIILENDGYDRVSKPGEFDPKRYQVGQTFTVMQNHMGSHLDTLAHIYRLGMGALSKGSTSLRSNFLPAAPPF